MTIKEAAELIGIHRMTLYRWLKKGSLEGTYYKAGNRIRFIRHKLLEYIGKEEAS